MLLTRKDFSGPLKFGLSGFHCIRVDRFWTGNNSHWIPPLPGQTSLETCATSPTHAKVRTLLTLALINSFVLYIITITTITTITIIFICLHKKFITCVFVRLKVMNKSKLN
jgi:hypothetical protein